MDAPLTPTQPESGPQMGVPEVPAVVAPEVTPAPASSVPSPAPLPVTTPVTTPVVPATTPTTPPGPSVAADVDVIEKEWVHAAESIIKQTGQDPHAEEEAVENLQVDYLKKRYGKDLKKPEET